MAHRNDVNKIVNPPSIDISSPVTSAQSPTQVWGFGSRNSTRRSSDIEVRSGTHRSYLQQRLGKAPTVGNTQSYFKPRNMEAYFKHFRGVHMKGPLELSSVATVQVPLREVLPRDFREQVWNLYYFELKDGMLHYYDSKATCQSVADGTVQAQDVCIGCVRLDNIISVRVRGRNSASTSPRSTESDNSDSSSSPCTFHLVTREMDISLRAATRDGRNDWLLAFHRSIGTIITMIRERTKSFDIFSRSTDMQRSFTEDFAESSNRSLDTIEKKTNIDPFQYSRKKTPAIRRRSGTVSQPTSPTANTKEDNFDCSFSVPSTPVTAEVGVFPTDGWLRNIVETKQVSNTSNIFKNNPNPFTKKQIVKQTMFPNPSFSPNLSSMTLISSLSAPPALTSSKGNVNTQTKLDSNSSRNIPIVNDVSVMTSFETQNQLGLRCRSPIYSNSNSPSRTPSMKVDGVQNPSSIRCDASITSTPSSLDRSMDNMFEFEDSSPILNNKSKPRTSPIIPSLLIPPSSTANSTFIKYEIEIGTEARQGARSKMEDRHVVLPKLEKLMTIDSISRRSDDQIESTISKICNFSPRHSFYAIFDGHSGTAAAEYCKEKLHYFLIKSPFFWTDTQQALIDACRELDKEYLDIARTETSYSGTTALIAVVRGDKLYTATLGDTMAVLCRDGVPVSLSERLTPGSESERKRIEAAGGWITEEKELFISRLHHMQLEDAYVREHAQDAVRWVVTHRVNGELSVSRSIGDPDYKGSGMEKYQWFFPQDIRDKAKEKENDSSDGNFNADLVISEPSTCDQDITASDEFLLLACDGLWDVLNEQEAIEIVRSELIAGSTVQEATTRVVDVSLAMGSGDNVSVIVVLLKPFQSFRQKNAEELTTRNMSESNNEERNTHLANDRMINLDANVIPSPNTIANKEFLSLRSVPSNNRYIPPSIRRKQEAIRRENNS